MSISESLLAELSQELENTRKMLEIIPETKLTWKPHEKSMSIAGLGGHMAQVGFWAERTMEIEVMDLTGVEPLAEPTSVEQILESFDHNFGLAREAIAGRPDEDFAVEWTLAMGEQVFFRMPRLACLRTFVFNHLYHHRGQLSVYLRLLDVPLPQVYGPTADAEGF